ncbi:hypothetical protein WCLP8_2560001 [uncultured Gammaproteobacteria bacterium]
MFIKAVADLARRRREATPLQKIGYGILIFLAMPFSFPLILAVVGALVAAFWTGE